MLTIRRSLDNCYVENNALMALFETQNLEIREIIGDVDMI